MKLLKTEEIVRKILTECSEARDNDDLLYAKVCEKICPNVLYTSFSYVLLHRNEFGLPIYESVRRTRQKLQELNEDLRGSLTTQERRAKNREEFLNYARS